MALLLSLNPRATTLQGSTINGSLKVTAPATCNGKDLYQIVQMTAGSCVKVLEIRSSVGVLPRDQTIIKSLGVKDEELMDVEVSLFACCVIS
jgi:hypothetical protein